MQLLISFERTICGNLINISNSQCRSTCTWLIVTPAMKTTIKNNFVMEIVCIDRYPTQQAKLRADASTSHSYKVNLRPANYSEQQQYTNASQADCNVRVGVDLWKLDFANSLFNNFCLSIRNMSWFSFYIYGHVFFHKIICS